MFDIKEIRDAYYRFSYKIHNNNVLLEILSAEELVKFTDKASYLEWVKEWKDFYSRLSIRQYLLRVDLSNPHSEIEDVSSKMQERRSNKLILRILLEARSIGKRHSWQMKQDRLARITEAQC